MVVLPPGARTRALAVCIPGVVVAVAPLVKGDQIFMCEAMLGCAYVIRSKEAICSWRRRCPPHYSGRCWSEPPLPL